MDIKPRQLEIMEAAGQLMTESGYAALTTKRLAERMGFSEPALYRHFKNKEEILFTMLHYLAASMEERLTEVTARVSDPSERVVAMFDSHFRFFTRYPHFLMAIFASGVLDQTPALDKGITDLMDVKRRHLLATIKEGQVKGVFTDAFPAEMLTMIAMGTFRLHMLRWRMSGRTFDLTKKGRALVKVVVELIRTR
ncbi:MAG: TetR/AcrR family transcriptional regulator [Flavobacteriales bacterium]|nr:TetR/AcrR family transcriptional regulator [Flavobacteriales bacterium]